MCSTVSGVGVRLVGKGRATSNSSEPRIGLLGGFSVAVGDSVVVDRAWRLRKAKALVKILALAPDRRVHRERLAELLWPDRDADAAANNLNQALYVARRALDGAGADGAAAVALMDGTVVLSAQVDVDGFEAAAARARADRDPAAYEWALGLYGGALLPEDRYEPWADARRAALRELHTGLCLELAELHGGAPAAVVALQRALVADPLAEPVHCALMRLYARTGRRQQALAQYQLLRQGLNAELAAEPDPATRALYQQLLAPPPAATAPQGGNLPRQLTSFVGRERELAEVARLLRRARLVTLTGAGRLRQDAPGARRSPPTLVDAATPTASGSSSWRRWPTRRSSPRRRRWRARRARAARPAPALAALAAHLRARATLLLVLDNCEHLLDACARLAEALLRALPRPARPGHQPRAAGRRRRGRLARAVPGLPDPSAAAAVDALAGARRCACSSSGRGRRGRLRADAQNAAAVAEVCRRLDGIPLALELAAARVPALPLEQLAARLDDRFRLLTGGSRTALPRQQTLRATLDWSHDLLTERGAGRCSAGWRSSPAAARWRRPRRSAPAAAIEPRRGRSTCSPRLVDKSLVVAEAGGGARYRLLETVRQYAAERLRGGRRTRRRRARHLDWCLALAEQPSPSWRPARDAGCTARGRARQPARRARLGRAPRPPGGAAAGDAAVAVLAGSRLLHRGQSLAADDAGRGARADAAARRGAARGRRPVAAPRRPQRLPAPRQRRRQRLPHARRRARNGRGALSARHARPVRPSRRRRGALHRSADAGAPPARRAPAGRGDPRVGDAAVVSRRQRDRAHAPARSTRAARRGARRRHAVLRRRRRSGCACSTRARTAAPGWSGRRRSSCFTASPAPRRSPMR